MASSRRSIRSLQVRFRLSHAAFICEAVGGAVKHEVRCHTAHPAGSGSHLVDRLLHFRFLRFSAGEDEVSPEGPDELQLLPQAVRLRLDGLIRTATSSRLKDRSPLHSVVAPPPARHAHRTSAASICCLMSDGSTPGSSSSFTMSCESRSVLSSAATSDQNFPARSRTSFSLPSRSSARCRISSHRERRRRRRARTAAGGRGPAVTSDGPDPNAAVLVFEVPLTLSGGVVAGRPADELLPAGAERREAGQQLVQLQALGPVLRQLLPDLLHLRGYRRGQPQPLHRPLQGLQQRVHFVVKLGEGGAREGVRRGGAGGGGESGDILKVMTF